MSGTEPVILTIVSRGRTLGNPSWAAAWRLMRCRPQAAARRRLMLPDRASDVVAVSRLARSS